MKMTVLVSCLLASCLVLSSNLCHAEDKSVSLSITYDYSCMNSKLTSILIKDGQLHYMWSYYPVTARKEGAALASMATGDLDRIQIDVRLTKKETAMFQEWVVRHKVFDFRENYPPLGAENRIFGVFMGSGLTVEMGGKKHRSNWTDANELPESHSKAISELTHLADEVRKRRIK